jgi:hypothetical protein
LVSGGCLWAGVGRFCFQNADNGAQFQINNKTGTILSKLLVEQLKKPVSKSDAKYQINPQPCPITNYEPMPRRQDLKKILLIGSGPIVIEKKALK